MNLVIALPVLLIIKSSKYLYNNVFNIKSIHSLIHNHIASKLNITPAITPYHPNKKISILNKIDLCSGSWLGRENYSIY